MKIQTLGRLQIYTGNNLLLLFILIYHNCLLIKSISVFVHVPPTTQWPWVFLSNISYIPNTWHSVFQFSLDKPGWGKVT